VLSFFMQTFLTVQFAQYSQLAFALRLSVGLVCGQSDSCIALKNTGELVAVTC
jgi:hypothetical protein